MKLGLEEFLKELRADENVFYMEFRFMEFPKHKQFLALYLTVRTQNDYRRRLEYDFSSHPTEKHQIKLPRSYKTLLLKIKKDLKNLLKA